MFNQPYTWAPYSIIKWFFRLVPSLQQQQHLWRHKEPFQSSSEMIQTASQPLKFYTIYTLHWGQRGDALLKGTVAAITQGKKHELLLPVQIVSAWPAVSPSGCSGIHKQLHVGADPEKVAQNQFLSYQKESDCNFLGNSPFCSACAWSNKSSSGVKDESQALDALYMANYSIK